jgi:hypothetical protein
MTGFLRVGLRVTTFERVFLFSGLLGLNRKVGGRKNAGGAKPDAIWLYKLRFLANFFEKSFLDLNHVQSMDCGNSTKIV